MIPDFTVKLNDAGKVLSGVLQDANGSSVNCTGFTSAKLFLTRFGLTTPKINGATFNLPTPSTGVWNYTLLSADVDAIGRFALELEVGYAAGRKETFPTDSDKPYMVVLIQKDLG